MRPRLLFIAILFAAFAAVGSAQTVNFVASSVESLGGSGFNGKLCLTPANNNGSPIAFQFGGGGQGTSQQNCYAVTGGVLQSGVTLPDTSLTTPSNLCIYAQLMLYSAAAGQSNVVNIYPCLQPASTGPAVSGSQPWCTVAGAVTTCDLAKYISPQPALVTSQAGPTGPAGPAPVIASVTASAGSYGSSPSAILSGTNPYTVAFQIPNGAPGTGSGTVGTSVAGAPVAAHPMGASGSSSNEVDAGAGPWNVAGLVANSSTDNTSFLQSAINAGHEIILPENCASGGNINVAGPLSYGSGLNAQSIKGGGWHSQLCQTNLLFTATTYATGAINLSSGNAVGASITDMNIGAAAGVTIASGAAIYSDAPGASNFQHFDKLQISGFPQAIVLTNVGNLDVGTVYLEGTGTVASAGLPLFQLTNSGNNSNKIWGLGGSCGTTEFNSAAGVTMFSFGTPSVVTSGMGNEFHTHDIVGCPQVAYQNGGQATWFFGNTEQRTGPILTLASGKATVNWGGEQGQMQYLGPPFVAAGSGSKMDLNTLVPLTTSIASLTLQSQSSTVGSYAAGNYWFWDEADGTLNAGAATVNLNSSVSASMEVTFASGSTNEVTLGFPVASTNTNPIVNASSYTIWRNTANTLSGAVEIATGVTGTSYLSTGSESTAGTAPPDANVPLALQGVNATITANCQNGPLSLGNPTANYHYAQMAMDRYGRYFNPCNGPEIPLADWAFATPSEENAGACDQVLVAPGGTGQDAKYCILTTGSAAGTSYQWVNVWASQGTLTYTSSINITTGSPAASVTEMRCTAACTVTLHTQPYGTWCSNIESTGSTLATVVLYTAQTWNSTATAPTLTTGKPVKVCTDSTTSTNWIGG